MLGNIEDYLMWSAIIGIAGAAAGIMALKVIPYQRFAYPAAKVQAIGNPFVREKEVGQLMESKSLDAVKGSLNALRDYNIEGSRAAEIQRSLDEHFVKSMQMLQNDSPKKLREFYDAYLRFVDSMAIKVALKLKMTGGKIENLPAILPDTRKVIEAIDASPIEELSSVLKARGFSDEVIDILRSDSKDLLMVDAAVDRMYLKQLQSVSVPREVKKAREEFVLRLKDIRNLKNLLRAKHLGYEKEECIKLFVGEGLEIPKWKFEEMASSKEIPDIISALEGTFYYRFLKERSDKEKGIQPLENALDRALLKIGNDISVKNFPLFGPLLRFMIAKEFEIKNLKIIVKGIEERVKVERMKTLMILEE